MAVSPGEKITQNWVWKASPTPLHLPWGRCKGGGANAGAPITQLSGRRAFLFFFCNLTILATSLLSFPKTENNLRVLAGSQYF